MSVVLVLVVIAGTTVKLIAVVNVIVVEGVSLVFSVVPVLPVS